LSSRLPAFEGFTKGTFRFLSDLEKNNNTKWFNENRDRYENFLVLPSKAFVSSMADFFNQLNPSIRTDPKFNNTLMRISKDMRFAKGDPYKNYFLIHFGRFKMDSEFYVYLDKSGIDYGVFLNNTQGDDLYLNQNINLYEKEITEAFRKFKLNRKYDLFELNKSPEIVFPKFDANKNFKHFAGMKYILLQNSFMKTDKIIYSADFLTSMIKTFSHLYPVYCFAISPKPLKLIEDFETRMGIPI
jgi:uncharacterized protein (TIGR02453 family)